ncbi:Transcription termination protein NusA [Olavius algarvensis Delta 1 endosymbiont]|nr:Transcription termination protein NusA [Olavius algarvensis Delta 1 endosymbiont]
MFISDIKRVVEQVSRDKGIDRDVLIRALEEALRSAARKKYGNKMDIEVQYNEESGEIEVFQFKEVAEVVTEPEIEISLPEGRKLDPECEVGDSLGTKMDTSTFGRIAAQSAKQVIIQKMKDAEKDAVYASFIDRKGEILNGIVQRIDRGDIIVNLGQTDGVVPVREQVPRESYRRGDRIRAYILDVLHESRGPQIVLSRTHPNFLIDLFKTEVPEISESIVSIMGASREPGVRAKIAVASNNSDIDPVGACVGMKGSRVQNVVQELRGEKIDIIPWHLDPAKFVCNALAPAEISRVIIDEANNSMEVIVPDEFLSIAIGKKGQNVRLASKLTGWHLDVKSETRYNQAMQTGYDSLVSLPGVGISLADALYESGFYSADEIASAAVEDLIQIRGIGEEKAAVLLDAAKTTAAENSAADVEEEDAEQGAENETTESAAEDEAEDLAAEDQPAEAEAADVPDESAAEGLSDTSAAEIEADESDAEDEATGPDAEDKTAAPDELPTPVPASDDSESKEG